MIELNSAVGMASEAGLKHALVNIYLEQMIIAEQDTHLHDELALCERAVDLLNPYDDRGAMLYQCDALKELIRMRH
jgi:hypothetical protein